MLNAEMMGRQAEVSAWLCTWSRSGPEQNGVIYYRECGGREGISRSTSLSPLSGDPTILHPPWIKRYKPEPRSDLGVNL